MADMPKNHLLDKAQIRTVLQAVVGGRSRAVMLNDGGVGMANLCLDVCGVPSHYVLSLLPQFPEGPPVRFPQPLAFQRV